jgi:hypothetical protein
MIAWDVVVFSGPTLAPARVAELLPGARCLGPARRGDVFRALSYSPKIICILDGVFGVTLPVWHKEILWALQHGVRVLGAASMGALRAAELAQFGMVGVGRVFEAFEREELENDDEVTVVHAGPEREYRPTSEALVDMRATLAAALHNQVVDASTYERLVGLARDMFYAERSYPALLAAAERAGLEPADRESLGRFLGAESNLVKLKRQDALACLGAIRRELDGSAASLPAMGADRPVFEFSYTDAFDAFLIEETRTFQALDSAKHPALASEFLVEELQLLGPDVFEPLLRQAGARALRVALGARGHSPAGPSLDLEVIKEASARGIQDVEELLLELDLSVEDYRKWMDEEVKIREVEGSAQELLQAQFGPLLRALGDYPRIAQRARRKLELCAAPPTPTPAEDVPGIWRAYFDGVLNLDVPDDLDAYAASVGFNDQVDLFAAVARELAFRRLG